MGDSPPTSALWTPWTGTPFALGGAVPYAVGSLATPRPRPPRCPRHCTPPTWHSTECLQILPNAPTKQSHGQWTVTAPNPSVGPRRLQDATHSPAWLRGSAWPTSAPATPFSRSHGPATTPRPRPLNTLTARLCPPCILPGTPSPPATTSSQPLVNVQNPTRESDGCASG